MNIVVFTCPYPPRDFFGVLGGRDVIYYNLYYRVVMMNSSLYCECLELLIQRLLRLLLIETEILGFPDCECIYCLHRDLMGQRNTKLRM